MNKLKIFLFFGAPVIVLFLVLAFFYPHGKAALTGSVQMTSNIQNQTDAIAASPTPAADKTQVPSGQSPQTQTPELKTAPITSPNKTQGSADPVTLHIPSIGLAAPVVRTGLESDNSLHVPSNPELAGWYELGPRPGEIGPAVITGHYDSKKGPGIFYNLKNAKVGDTVEVVRNDGSITRFKIVKTELYLQDDFPAQKVYGSIDNAGLRIITCAGTYDSSTGHYSHDLVVYANMTEIIQPGTYQPL